MRFLLILSLLSCTVLADKPVRGWFDIPHQEYPQFTPRYIEVDKDENGLESLHEAIESIQEIPGIDEAHSKKKYSPKEAQKWLKTVDEHRNDFEKLFRSVQAKHLQPEKKISVTDSYEKLMSTIAASKNLGWLAQLHLASGNVKSSTDYIKLHFECSSKLFHSDGALVGYLIAAASYNAHLHGLYKFLQADHVQPEDLDSINKLFIELPVIRASAKRSLDYEFVTFQNCLVSMHKGDLSMFSDEPKENFFKRALKLVFTRVLFQPNKSTAILANHTLLLQSMLETPVYNRKKLNREYESKVSSKFENKINLFSLNSIGRTLLRMSLAPIKRTAITTTDQIALKSAFIETTMALKAYKLKYKKLPSTLDSLTPQFIAKLPNDPYTGKPLHYNRTLKILWSVGSDFKNENGHDPALLDKENPLGDLEDQNDPTLPIPF